MKTITLIAVLLACSFLVCGQTDKNEVTKVTMKYDRKAILNDFLQMTPEQAKVFWPIYEHYEAERMDLDNRRVKLVTDYLSSYKNLDENTSDGIVREAMSIQRSDLALREKYYRTVKKELKGVMAARFYQIEEAIQAAVKNEIYSGLPVLQPQKQ